MFLESDTLNPAAIAAATDSATSSATEIRRKAPKKAGHKGGVTQRSPASPTNTSKRAIAGTQPNEVSPLAGSSIVDGLPVGVTHTTLAIDNPIRDAAIPPSDLKYRAPHHEHLTADSLPRYTPTPAVTATIENIVSVHRERQKNIKAKTSLILQAKALVRSLICTDADFEDDDTKAEALTAYGTQKRKLTKSAMARVDAAMKAAIEDPGCDIGLMVAPYFGGIGLFDARQKTLEKLLVKEAKTLPAYEWAKSVKGLGDVSFATLVGECGDIGTYKSIAAVWKRLGLAVMDGKRQGAPGEGASSQDWIDHGYNKARRSVSWNARNGVIGGMGMWRPMFGDTLEDATEYQRVFAERARYESEKLGLPIVESDKGKESYKAHVVARAFRYTEKRMIKHLCLAWRRA